MRRAVRQARVRSQSRSFTRAVLRHMPARRDVLLSRLILQCPLSQLSQEPLHSCLSFRGIATVQMFISFCRVVLDKIDPSALNLVCYALFVVDVVQNPNYMIVYYFSKFFGI